jgi:maltooligosyltrehalose trehalohydrolase
MHFSNASGVRLTRGTPNHRKLTMAAICGETVEYRGKPGTPVGRRLPIGAELQTDGSAHFRVWAPRRRRVAAVVPATPWQRGHCADLHRDEEGYFTGTVSDAGPGRRYAFRLDELDRLLPDPASRFQPDGPTGLSELIDPTTFEWTDQKWGGISAQRQVIYEMHIGTFTCEGTWNAAAKELAELARLGVTIVEVMPVADFPGEFGWGYDGVCLFAPTRLYGRPDDFRRFVNRAHAVGLGVILDVVYNHFGPVDNLLPQFAEEYVSNRHPNEWGAGINFDGENSAPVREFVRANVKYWIDEFHLDGLRFDATQSIHDESREHILTELVQTARETAGSRQVLIVAENEPQHVRMLRPRSAGGHGMDAAWNDDFHHSATVNLTGHNEAYYSDYLGSVAELLAAAKRGFLYQGQRSQWQKQTRGTPTVGLPATAFVNFLQNHDQIASSGLGERIDKLTSPGRLRAMTALWLLLPQTPMFFQGQEFAASSPFLYFADTSGEQARRVAAGREEFLSQFPSLATTEARGRLAPPHERATFECCRLDFSERQSHAAVYALHRDLLRLRREDPLFSRQNAELLDGAPLSHDCLAIRYFEESGGDRLLVVNFGRDWRFSPLPEPLLASPAGRAWKLIWSSNQAEYGGTGTPEFETDEGWRIPGEVTIVLAAVADDQINAPPPLISS